MVHGGRSGARRQVTNERKAMPILYLPAVPGLPGDDDGHCAKRRVIRWLGKTVDQPKAMN